MIAFLISFIVSLWVVVLYIVLTILCKWKERKGGRVLGEVREGARGRKGRCRREVGREEGQW